MVALSQRWRWSGVLTLLMMGLVSGCFSDEEEAAPTEETDSSESAEAQENADGENTAEGGGEGSEEVVEPDEDESDVAEPDVVDDPDVEEPDVDEPDVEEPDVDEPDVAEPDVAEADVAEPDVSEPDVVATDVQDESDVEEPEPEEPDEPGPSEPTLFSCITEVCSPKIGDSPLPSVYQEAEWSCSFDALAENAPKLHSVTLNKFFPGMFVEYYLIQAGYPCRKVRIATSSKEMDVDEGASFGAVSECQLKPPEYFGSCTAALVAWSDGDQENTETLLSCVEPNSWFGNCQSTTDLQCPLPFEPGEEGEDCGN